jgi:hypothetical protein
LNCRRRRVAKRLNARGLPVQSLWRKEAPRPAWMRGPRRRG